MRCLDTNHVISGPMRGLKKADGEGTSVKQTDMSTDLAQRADPVKIITKNPAYGRQSISRPMRIVAPMDQKYHKT